MKGFKIWLQSFVILAMIVATGSLGGCTTLKNFFSKPEGEATAKVVIQVAVFNLLTDKPEYKDIVLEITKDIRNYVAADKSARIDTVMVLVDQRIKWNKLSPADAMAISSLLTLVEVNLQEKVKDNTLSPDLILNVNKVIGWIEAVAKASYGRVHTAPPPDNTQANASPPNGAVADLLVISFGNCEADCLASEERLWVYSPEANLPGMALASN